MAENKAEIVVDGDVSPLRQKLRAAGSDLKQFGDEGKSSIEGIGAPLAALQSKFIAIGAVLAGGAVFKQAVSAAAEFTEESLKLGNALGISPPGCRAVPADRRFPLAFRCSAWRGCR